MDPNIWRSPVKLCAPLGRFHEIASADEAFECLLNYWPPDADGQYYEAKRACMDALTIGRPAEESRRAFIAAADEVGIETTA